MRTRFFPHPAEPELTYLLADEVNGWHKRHEKFHNELPPMYTPFMSHCIVSTTAGTDYFAITYKCDFTDT